MKRIGGRNDPTPVSKEPQMVYMTHICLQYIVKCHVRPNIEKRVLSWVGEEEVPI